MSGFKNCVSEYLPTRFGISDAKILYTKAMCCFMLVRSQKWGDDLEIVRCNQDLVKYLEPPLTSLDTLNVAISKIKEVEIICLCKKFSVVLQYYPDESIPEFLEKSGYDKELNEVFLDFCNQNNVYNMVPSKTMVEQGLNLLKLAVDSSKSFDVSVSEIPEVFQDFDDDDITLSSGQQNEDGELSDL